MKKQRQIDDDEGITREAREIHQSQGRFRLRYQQGDDVGVYHSRKKGRGGGIPGSIKNSPCCIWIQRTTRRNGSDSRGGRGQGKGSGNK